jgi:predicted ABC-type ATPase
LWSEVLSFDLQNFAFETTLATRSYKHRILEAKMKNYNVTLLFFWLKNPELAKERVKTRVMEGGHFIPEDVIERRYYKGIRNLFGIYLSIVDQALIFGNYTACPIFNTLIASSFSWRDRFG